MIRIGCRICVLTHVNLTAVAVTLMILVRIDVLQRLTISRSALGTCLGCHAGRIDPAVLGDIFRTANVALVVIVASYIGAFFHNLTTAVVAHVIRIGCRIRVLTHVNLTAVAVTLMIQIRINMFVSEQIGNLRVQQQIVIAAEINLRPLCISAAVVDSLQCAAAAECLFLDTCYALGNSDTDKTGTALKHVAADRLETVRQLDRRQCRAILEHIPITLSHILGNRNALERNTTGKHAIAQRSQSATDLHSFQFRAIAKRIVTDHRCTTADRQFKHLVTLTESIVTNALQMGRDFEFHKACTIECMVANRANTLGHRKLRQIATPDKGIAADRSYTVLDHHIQNILAIIAPRDRRSLCVIPHRTRTTDGQHTVTGENPLKMISTVTTVNHSGTIRFLRLCFAHDQNRGQCQCHSTFHIFRRDREDNGVLTVRDHICITRAFQHQDLSNLILNVNIKRNQTGLFQTGIFITTLIITAHFRHFTVNADRNRYIHQHTGKRIRQIRYRNRQAYTENSALFINFCRNRSTFQNNQFQLRRRNHPITVLIAFKRGIWIAGRGQQHKTAVTGICGSNIDMPTIERPFRFISKNTADTDCCFSADITVNDQRLFLTQNDITATSKVTDDKSVIETGKSQPRIVGNADIAGHAAINRNKIAACHAEISQIGQRQLAGIAISIVDNSRVGFAAGGTVNSFDDTLLQFDLHVSADLEGVSTCSGRRHHIIGIEHFAVRHICFQRTAGKNLPHAAGSRTAHDNRGGQIENISLAIAGNATRINISKAGITTNDDLAMVARSSRDIGTGHTATEQMNSIRAGIILHII